MYKIAVTTYYGTGFNTWESNEILEMETVEDVGDYLSKYGDWNERYIDQITVDGSEHDLLDSLQEMFSEEIDEGREKHYNEVKRIQAEEAIRKAKIITAHEIEQLERLAKKFPGRAIEYGKKYYKSEDQT